VSVCLSIYIYVSNLSISIYLSNLFICLFIYLSIYGSTTLVDLGRFFSFLIYTQYVGLLGRVISQLQGRYLHGEQHKDIHASSGIRTDDPSVRANEDTVIGSREVPLNFI
jgi:hypothetical protein